MLKNKQWQILKFFNLDNMEVNLMNQIKKGVSNAKNAETVDNTEVTSTKKNIDMKSMLIGIFGASTIALIIAVIALLSRDTDPYRYIEAENIVVAVEESFFDTQLSATEAKEAALEVAGLVEAVRDNNGYIHVYTDEDTYDTYIYNKNGEAFGVGSDSTNMTVFRNDGKAVRYTDTILVAEDLDILELTLNSLYAVDGKQVEMYKAESTAIDTDAYTGYREYYAVFDTYEEIRNLYSSVSTEYADSMIESIKSAFHEGVVPTFKIFYMISDGGGLTVACHLVEEDTAYLNWYYDGYLLVYDWKLDDEWYTYDFSDAEKSEDMLTALSESLENMLMQYAEDNEVTVTEQGATTETEGASAEEEPTIVIEGEIDLSEVGTLTEEQAKALLENSLEEDAGAEGAGACCSGSRTQRKAQGRAAGKHGRKACRNPGD